MRLGASGELDFLREFLTRYWDKKTRLRVRQTRGEEGREKGLFCLGRNDLPDFADLVAVGFGAEAVGLSEVNGLDVLLGGFVLLEDVGDGGGAGGGEIAIGIGIAGGGCVADDQDHAAVGEGGDEILEVGGLGCFDFA